MASLVAATAAAAAGVPGQPALTRHRPHKPRRHHPCPHPAVLWCKQAPGCPGAQKSPPPGGERRRALWLQAVVGVHLRGPLHAPGTLGTELWVCPLCRPQVCVPSAALGKVTTPGVVTSPLLSSPLSVSGHLGRPEPAPTEPCFSSAVLKVALPVTLRRSPTTARGGTVRP